MNGPRLNPARAPNSLTPRIESMNPCTHFRPPDTVTHDPHRHGQAWTRADDDGHPRTPATRRAARQHTPRRRLQLLFGCWLIGSFATLFACRQQESATLVVSGRVETDRSHIGSKVGGRVEKVNVDEGDEVKAGDVVIVLDRSELEAELAAAKASAAQAKAQLDLLIAGARKEDIARAEATVAARKAELALRKEGFRSEEIREAEARRESAQSNLELAQKEYDRAKTLLGSRTINQQEFDLRDAALQTARAALEQAAERLRVYQTGSRPEEIAAAEAQLAVAQADLERLRNGARPEELDAARAALAAAQATAQRVQTQLDETEVRAPEDSVVETLDLHPGDLVKPGQTLAILNTKNRAYVRCFVPELRLGDVAPGRAVSVSVDAYPGEVFPGVIRHVNADAEFTPRNVQTTEKRAELVFEMKVDITKNGDRLRPGMYADVTVPRSAAK